MSTLVTPSAKSHERVTGRWIRDFEVSSRKEWLIYYAKQIVGTPIPWLFSAFICLVFFSRAGLEIAGWACASLTLVYIALDRFSRTREFTFFRVGADFFLLGYMATAIAGAFATTYTGGTLLQGLDLFGGVRWVVLLYALTYCWELFPGLNRIFFLMVGVSVAAAAYGIWQHFTGLDLIRGVALPSAPVEGRVYFISSGFFGRPEIFGTIMAAVLPFPAAAFLLSDRRNEMWERVLSLSLVLVLSLATFWTYRSGLWGAAGAGLIITMLMKGRNTFSFAAIVTIFFTGLMFLGYGSPELLVSGVQDAEIQRATLQREQINAQVALWQKSSWIGVGNEAHNATSYDPGTGNVYFQVLAQSGVLGASFYLLFILAFLLSTYRVFQEIPATHYWHRVLVSGALGSQIAFHTAGLYWSTLTESLALNFFILVLSAVAYVTEHYGRGLVPDDFAL